ncbi:MAG: hypothetical protein D6814_00785 [Calditrichaeota bacterium]|nr:MAG: hypothetical protein D6814_00785 [Calditrichota bacterium]
MGIYVTILAGDQELYSGKISNGLASVLMNTFDQARQHNLFGESFLAPAGKVEGAEDVERVFVKLCRHLHNPRFLLPRWDSNDENFRAKQARAELGKMVDEMKALELALGRERELGREPAVRWG